MTQEELAALIADFRFYYGHDTELTDAEVTRLLDKAGNNVFRAVGDYYSLLARLASEQSKTVKDHDLSVDLRQRASDLRDSAADSYARADDYDERNGISHVFVIADAPGFSAYTWVEGL